MQKSEQISSERNRLRQVGLEALAILERPPVAEHFFDGMGTSDLGAKYKVKRVSAEHIVDCGERTQVALPPSLQSSILHQHWPVPE